MKLTTGIAFAYAFLSYGAFALEPSGQDNQTAITIYSKAGPGAIDPNLYRPIDGQSGYNGMSVPGYAIVRQARTIDLPQEENSVQFSDVAAYIDPTTVQFTSLTDPKGTKVAEQSYRFDLVSQQKLLEKYIDKKISVQVTEGNKSETVEGVLLSTQGGLTLKTADGNVRALSGYSSVSFPDLPGGLITRPTLQWDVIARKRGEQKAEVSYETSGITWWADYNLTYHEGKDANSGTVDFGSWVSIINQTGATYNGAKLKLVAGDVQRAAQNGNAAAEADAALAAPMPMRMKAIAPRFDEKSFFEYHLYTLNRPVTLPDNSTKQMELVPAATGVPVEKLFIYNGSSAAFYGNNGVYSDRNFGADSNGAKVDVYLKLLNTKEAGLGVPLPAGRIRLNQRDDDGSLEFIGEDTIDHTPRNEKLLIKLGSAFDVVGERRQLNYDLDTMRRTADEEIEIKIRNQKKQPVRVKVLENMYRAVGWDILSSSLEYQKENAHQVSFPVTVEPEKDQVVTYKVRYSW